MNPSISQSSNVLAPPPLLRGSWEDIIERTQQAVLPNGYKIRVRTRPRPTGRATAYLVCHCYGWSEKRTESSIRCGCPFTITVSGDSKERMVTSFRDEDHKFHNHQPRLDNPSGEPWPASLWIQHSTDSPVLVGPRSSKKDGKRPAAAQQTISNAQRFQKWIEYTDQPGQYQISDLVPVVDWQNIQKRVKRLRPHLLSIASGSTITPLTKTVQHAATLEGSQYHNVLKAVMEKIGFGYYGERGMGEVIQAVSRHLQPILSSMPQLGQVLQDRERDHMLHYECIIALIQEDYEGASWEQAAEISLVTCSWGLKHSGETLADSQVIQSKSSSSEASDDSEGSDKASSSSQRQGRMKRRGGRLPQRIHVRAESADPLASHISVQGRDHTRKGPELKSIRRLKNAKGGKAKRASSEQLNLL